MAYENVLIAREDGVAWLTINRPKVLNALNCQTVDEIAAVVEEVRADDAVRVLVITGAGDRSFVAGADINEIMALDSAVAGADMARRGQVVFASLRELRKPVIAAVNGFALGGGCELALAADIRVAADTAKMGLPEINLGIIPGYGGTQRLARLIGPGAAKRMIFTGDMVDAAEALRLGLVDEVVPAAELRGAVADLAAKLATKAPIAMGQAKRSIDDGLEVDLERGCTMEATNFGLVCATEDRVEGTRAFLEKRPPAFQGK